MPTDPVDFDQTDHWDIDPYMERMGLDEKTLLGFVALAIVTLGVKSIGEVYFAIAAQFVYWYCGHKGPAGMYSALAGIQWGHDRYQFAAFATAIDAYYLINGLGTKKVLSYNSMMATIIWFVGFFLAKYKYL